MENIKETNLAILCLKKEIATLGEIVKKMQDLEARKEQAIASVRTINHKYDQKFFDLVQERDCLNEKKENLLNKKKEIMDRVNKIYWFMFWRIFEKIRLNRELKGLNLSIKEIDGNLHENLVAQWNIKPTFQSECTAALGGIEVLFLNVSSHYDNSNDDAVRKQFDKENHEVIEEYQAIINSILLKCIDHINKKTHISPECYAMYFKIDIQTILDRYTITPEVFQSDILLRIESLIDEMFNPITILDDSKKSTKTSSKDDNGDIIKKKKI